MPNRIIKESICSSEDIESLKAEEEIFYYRLWVNCDDYGRFDARPLIIKSKLYPLKEHVKSDDINRYLKTLLGKGMIELYRVKGVEYGQVMAWDKHQQIRAKRSKYPSMSESDITCNQEISNDDICHRNPIQSNPIQSESESGDKPRKQKFVEPTVDQVKDYCLERKNNVNAQKWHDFYTGKGWMVGKTKMVDWKAAVRTWEEDKNEKAKSKLKMVEIPEEFKEVL